MQAYRCWKSTQGEFFCRSGTRGSYHWFIYFWRASLLMDFRSTFVAASIHSDPNHSLALGSLCTHSIGSLFAATRDLYKNYGSCDLNIASHFAFVINSSKCLLLAPYWGFACKLWMVFYIVPLNNLSSTLSKFESIFVSYSRCLKLSLRGNVM